MRYRYSPIGIRTSGRSRWRSSGDGRGWVPGREGLGGTLFAVSARGSANFFYVALPKDLDRTSSIEAQVFAQEERGLHPRIVHGQLGQHLLETRYNASCIELPAGYAYPRRPIESPRRWPAFVAYRRPAGHPQVFRNLLGGVRSTFRLQKVFAHFKATQASHCQGIVLLNRCDCLGLGESAKNNRIICRRCGCLAQLAVVELHVSRWSAFNPRVRKASRRGSLLSSSMRSIASASRRSTHCSETDVVSSSGLFVE